MHDDLSKPELLAIAKGLRAGDAASVEAAVEFLTSESRGHWHNRARAKFSRRLKHCPLDPQQAGAIVRAVAARLVSGTFSEQFADQVRLALRLDPDTMRKAASQASASSLDHVRRYGAWVLEHHPQPG